MTDTTRKQAGIFGSFNNVNVKVINYGNDGETGFSKVIMDEVITIGDCGFTNKRRIMKSLSLKKVSESIVENLAEARWSTNGDDDAETVQRSHFDGTHGSTLHATGTKVEATLTIPTKKRTTAKNMKIEIAELVTDELGNFALHGEANVSLYVNKREAENMVKSKEVYEAYHDSSWREFPGLSETWYKKHSGNSNKILRLRITNANVADSDNE